MRGPKSFILVALILSVLLIITATVSCGQAILTDEGIADSIFVRLSTDKDTYKLGQQVNIDVYVENQSSEVFNYEYAQIKIHLSIWSESGDYVGITEDGNKYVVEIMPANLGTLNAGESITLETFWDQKFINDNGEEYTASAGNYTIKANFAGLEYLRSREGLPSDKDSVSVNILIEE